MMKLHIRTIIKDPDSLTEIKAEHVIQMYN